MTKSLTLQEQFYKGLKEINRKREEVNRKQAENAIKLAEIAKLIREYDES